MYSPSDKSLSALTTYQAGIIEASSHRNIQKISDALLAKYGLTTMQWLLIGLIYDHQSDNISLTFLAEQLNTGLPYITNMLNLLESKSIIDRKSDKNDSRIKRIWINKSFEPKIADIEKSLREVLRNKIYSNIDVEDFKNYIKVLSIISSKLN